MYQPLPHGQGAVGGAPTEEDSAAVELLARRLENLKGISGLDSLRMVRTLPDGGYVIAQNMGGIFKCITHKPMRLQPDTENDGVAQTYIPMLFSGIITKAIIREENRIGPEGPEPDLDYVSMTVSEQTRIRLAGYDAKEGEREKLPAKELFLQRFTIDYYHLFYEFIPPDVKLRYTQYAAQKPTWYSGAMAEVMQIVGGYGRQDLAELPDDPIERARLNLPPKVMRKIELAMINIRLPGYTGFPSKTGQFKYDYKFNNTNAVAFDDGGYPWLVQVGDKGVHVMPLPLIPATTTQPFREWVEEVNDSEILEILDRFGGMPSGESFPEHEDYFEAWRRAGVIIKVCDTADFYDHYPYASSVGWSFNTSGTEGYNTCYDYNDDDNIGYGLAYKLSMRLAATKDRGSLPPKLNVDDPVKAGQIDQYLSSLYRIARENNPTNLALKYKLRRVPVTDILSKASKGAATKADYDYWNDLELEPIAIHTGSVAQVGRGNLYSPIRHKHQPQLKFPEPFAQGCVSHDFLPLGASGMNFDPGGGPKCDTIVFGYYAGDDLKVIKYFRDGNSFDRKVDSDFEECMTVGYWEETSYGGSSRVLGNFYLSDIDKRDTVSDSVSVTKIVGRDKGYSKEPSFEVDHPWSEVGSMWRQRYYEHRTKSSSTSGHYLKIGVCVPFFNRNCVLHASKGGSTANRDSDGNDLYSVMDPNTYRYHTYHQIYAWMGGSTKGNKAFVTKADPAPSEGNPVWVMGYNYNPTTCSDFADAGDWVGGLPSDYTWLIHPDANVWNGAGGGGAPAFVKFSTENVGEGKSDREILFSFDDSPKMVHKREINDGYFEGSPDDYGHVFYRDSCSIVFGQSVYCNVSEVTDSGSSRVYWGYCKLVDNNKAYHFIGVINE